MKRHAGRIARATYFVALLGLIGAALLVGLGLFVAVTHQPTPHGDIGVPAVTSAP